jgi:hypothetical protein
MIIAAKGEDMGDTVMSSPERPRRRVKNDLFALRYTDKRTIVLVDAQVVSTG